MYSYYANNPIIQTLTDEQLEAAYRVRQMQYRIEDIKAHAEDMFDHGNLTAAEYDFVCKAAPELAERYIYKFQDCSLAENDVMVNMIDYYCQDHAQEIIEMKEQSFNTNEDCALALFDYLKAAGKIEGTEYDRETILHDINNLRGHEWLQNMDRSQETKPFFDYIGFPEFSGDEFAFSETVSPSAFLKIAVGQEFPEDTSFDKVRDVLDENGFSELWDYPTDELDEATGNLGEDTYLLAVSFYEPDGYFSRIFEITAEMAERLWALESGHNLPAWAQDLDEIDQDCVEQYGVLLGRPLASYAEYIEIDAQVNDMILDYEDPEKFFAKHPALEKYRAGAGEKAPLDAQIGSAAQRSAGGADTESPAQEPER